MTNYNKRLDEVLANLVNQVAANEQRLLNGNATRKATIGSDSHATTQAKQALTSLTKELVDEVIGEDNIKKPNSDDYNDWTVCDTCDVILDDLTEPAMACICDRRNELRAEQRKRNTQKENKDA